MSSYRVHRISPQWGPKGRWWIASGIILGFYGAKVVGEQAMNARLVRLELHQEVRDAAPLIEEIYEKIATGEMNQEYLKSKGLDYDSVVNSQILHSTSTAPHGSRARSRYCYLEPDMSYASRFAKYGEIPPTYKEQGFLSRWL